MTAGCEIYGTVRNSVLGTGVRVGRGALVEDSVLMNGARVEDGATVRYAILDANVTVGKHAAIGRDWETVGEIAVVGADCVIGEGEIVPSGAMISEETQRKEIAK